MKLAIHCCWTALLIIACGCITRTPRPHRFVDTANTPSVFVDYAAWSEGSKLVLDVAPKYSTPTFYGIRAFREGDDFYLYPSYDTLMTFAFEISSIDSTLNSERQWIGTRTNGMYRFTIDTARYGMQSSWPSHTFWLIETGSYWFPGRRFWSDTHRDPAVRSKIEVRPFSSNKSLQPTAAASGS